MFIGKKYNLLKRRNAGDRKYSVFTKNKPLVETQYFVSHPKNGAKQGGDGKYSVSTKSNYL